MKRILMLGTGGTIASEMTPEGLTPELTPAQLLKYVPGISDLCHVDCLSLFSMDSTNIRPEHWLMVAMPVAPRNSFISRGMPLRMMLVSSLPGMWKDRNTPWIYGCLAG